MPDQIDNYAIEFNKSVLKGLRLSIADIYRQLVKHGRGGTNAEQILKHRIDRIAMTELCPQVFKAITEQYEMMKQPDASLMKNGVRYDQFNWDIKDTETLDILRKNNVFMTSKYYNRLDAENITERIAQVFERGKSPSSVANGLRQEFNGVYKNLASYNEMFVDTISHTARNFANINTYQQIGVKYSKIVGFKDELTCGRCSRLIGRIVSVETQAKAVDAYLSVDFEKLGYDKALEQIKTVNPWWTEKQLIKAGFEKPSYGSDAENIKDTAKLIKPGLELPIFHGRCRCSTAAWFENKNSLPLVSGGGGGILPVKPVVKPVVPTVIKPLAKPAPDSSIIDVTGNKPFDLNNNLIDKATIENLRKDNIRLSFDEESIKIYNSSIMKNFDYKTVHEVLTDSFGKGITTVQHYKKWEKFEFDFTNKNVEISRMFDPDNKIVDHSYFKIEKSMQGKGLSKKILKAFDTQYRSMGIEKITINASLDAGGYTWAKYGFAAKRKAVEQIFNDVKMKKFNSIEQDLIKTTFEKVLSNNSDYVILKPIADLMLDGRAIGKDILSGETWKGIFDYKNKEQLKIWEDYING